MVSEAVQKLAARSENLVATSVLALGGLVFGAVFFQEADWSDKVDDGGFLVVGLGILVWYLWPGNCFRRSWLPIAVAAFSVGVQLVGLFLERDDPRAFGDNIGGLLYFGAALILAVAQRWRNAAVIRAVGSS